MDYRHLVDFFCKKVKADNISAYAAQATLFIFLSVVPFLLIFSSLIRFTPVTENMVLAALQALIPNNISHLSPFLTGIVDEVYHNSPQSLTVAVVIAVYSAAKAIHSLRNGLNTVYGITETRNWFKLRLRAMAETFAMVWLIILSLILLVFGRKIQHMMVHYASFVSDLTTFILRIRLVIIFFFLIFIFTLIYKVLPNRKAGFRSQLVGAVSCSVAWYVFSFGLSFFVNDLNGFSLYGSIATLVLILFWLYFCMFIFLVCGEINSIFEQLCEQFLMIRAHRKSQKEKKISEQDKENS